MSDKRCPHCDAGLPVLSMEIAPAARMHKVPTASGLARLVACAIAPALAPVDYANSPIMGLLKKDESFQ